MKREAQPPLSIEGEQALDHYAHSLQQLEDLSAVTIRNYLSDLRQFMAWCECSWREEQDELPLNATARSVLGRYLETLPQEGSHLFPSEKTQAALMERALGHLITKYAWVAHLVDVSPHDLRHRFGYRMAEVVPLHRLAQIMGHDSLDTTMLYIRGTKQDLQHEVEKIAWT